MKNNINIAYGLSILNSYINLLKQLEKVLYSKKKEVSQYLIEEIRLKHIEFDEVLDNFYKLFDIETVKEIKEKQQKIEENYYLDKEKNVDLIKEIKRLKRELLIRKGKNRINKIIKKK